ncbi:MAG TPA: hypothetical protein VLB44_23190 [Kofleriaceae bacterium]|nr:hypothetical protein [Kofleriaceae bacterium]
MSPLANQIYKHLLSQVRRHRSSITYGELATAIEIHPRSPKLHSALGEVTNACRHANLPALPAIVWRAGIKRPSNGYYRVAHPRAHTDEARVAAWEREHARVVSAVAEFPPRLA